MTEDQVVVGSNPACSIMIVIDINNISIYLHKYNNVCHSVGIPLTVEKIGEPFIVVSFNDDSTVYHEQPNPNKSPLSPYCQCIWNVSVMGKYGMGIGELDTRMG